MKKILFVCQANVGRSQMAEGFYNFLTGSKEAISAGVEDYAQKYIFHPTPEIVATLTEKGVDISRQRIKPLTESMCGEAERIVVLCYTTLCPDYLLNNQKTIFRKVTDPFKQETSLVRKIRDEIETIVKGLL